jgi:hypothetical protein
LTLDSFAQILGYLGVGALASALLTVIIQAYFQRKDRQRQYFRELVITPDFLQFMGAVELLHKNLSAVTVQTTIDEARAILDETIKKYENSYSKLVSAGGTFLIPDKARSILEGVTDGLRESLLMRVSGQDEQPGDALFMTTFDAMPEIRKRLEEIRAFMKRYLGIPS